MEATGGFLLPTPALEADPTPALGAKQNFKNMHQIKVNNQVQTANVIFIC